MSSQKVAAPQFGWISLSLLFLITCGTPLHAQSDKNAAAQEGNVKFHASGPFDVKVSPASPDEQTKPIGLWILDKQYHGDLEATSSGQMLAASTSVKGSAGYVAMEVVNGTLSGHKGTFVLQHIGTMTKGAPQMSVIVVPDSGTGQLIGLAGSMTIKIEGGKHSYEFDYTLPEAH